METRQLQLVDRHPDAARFDALSTGLLSCMTGLAFAFLVVGLTNASGPFAGALLAAGVAHGLITTARWLIRQRANRVIYLPDLPSRWHATMRAMADDANIIRGLIAKTPPGPIFDHLCEAHLAAVNALNQCVVRAELAGSTTSPDSDVLADQSELRQLVVATQRLRVTHETMLLRRPLTDLTERTDRIRAALEADDLTRST